jgi:hypothetical protein
MAINNQDSNIELTSPVYFTKDATCHPQFPQKVNPKSITKINFITGVDRDTIGGVLLYRLPQKTDTSTHTQLLFIWGYRCNIFYPLLVYSQVWLIEHEDTLVWDKDKLRMLYDKYYELWYTDDDSGPYLLNDNTKMNVEEGFFYGGYEMHAFVSEEKRYLSYRKPLWVDPNR